MLMLLSHMHNESFPMQTKFEVITMAKDKNTKKEKKAKTKGEIPNTVSGQNTGFNAKKEGLGQNTNR